MKTRRTKLHIVEVIPTLKVKKLHEDALLPEKAHKYDSGFDLFALEDTVIPPGERVLVKTGIAIELAPGYEAQVRSKSGLALKEGVIVLNSPGTVDCGYSNEVGVILWNTYPRGEYVVKAKSKIAQLVIAKVELPEIEEVTGELYAKLDNERGLGGFGSTGLEAKADK